MENQSHLHDDPRESIDRRRPDLRDQVTTGSPDPRMEPLLAGPRLLHGMEQRKGCRSLEPNPPRVLNASYHLFDLDHLGLDGQAFIVIRDGKPTLAYRRFTRDRWSPEIMPNTPES